MSFYDPRLRSLGCRIICPKDSLDMEADVINYKISYEDYEAIRLLYGVLEGSKETKNLFPLNLNFQYLNGVSFNKGCYIGQELVQRTHHTGVIRKIAMPFICTDKLSFKFGDESDKMFQGHIVIPFQSLNKKQTASLIGKNIVSMDGTVIGHVMASRYNCGIAMIDKEILENLNIKKFTIDGANTIIYDPITLWESVKEIDNQPHEN
jgi:folate-binding protein YgfZ